jgi:hypothetical protein
MLDLGDAVLNGGSNLGRIVIDGDGILGRGFDALLGGLGKPDLALVECVADRAVQQDVHAGAGGLVICARSNRSQPLAEFGAFLLGRLFEGGAVRQRQEAALAMKRLARPVAEFRLAILGGVGCSTFTTASASVPRPVAAFCMPRPIAVPKASASALAVKPSVYSGRSATCCWVS